MNEPLISFDQAREYLGDVSPSWLYKRTATSAESKHLPPLSERIPCYKLSSGKGGTIKFRISDLDKWLKSKKAALPGSREERNDNAKIPQTANCINAK